MAVRLNGNLIRTHQFTIVGMDYMNTFLIVPLVTTKPCKVNLYWTGPIAQFRVFLNLISTTTQYLILTWGTKNFSMDLNTSGTWYFSIKNSVYDFTKLSNTTVNITTFSNNSCSNPCF
jgi:hypothetical protein